LTDAMLMDSKRLAPETGAEAQRLAAIVLGYH